MKYRLEGRTPVPCNDLIAWAQWMGTHNGRVAQDTIGEVWISTVFLGIDHNWTPGGRPLLFETMTFGPSFAQIQQRCSTYMQAEAMHAAVVDLVREAHEQSTLLGEDVIRKAMVAAIKANEGKGE